MKLSEAISKGSVGKNQIQGSFFGSGDNECCALGAAGIAVNKSPTPLKGANPVYLGDLFGEFSDVLRSRSTHPVTNLNMDIENIVISLNDDHFWTFEKISEWLRSIGQ